MERGKQFDLRAAIRWKRVHCVQRIISPRIGRRSICFIWAPPPQPAQGSWQQIYLRELVSLSHGGEIK